VDKVSRIYNIEVNFKINLWVFKICRKYKKNAEDTTPTVVSSEESMANLGSEKMNEYLMGSRNLKVVPVGMSLIAR